MKNDFLKIFVQNQFQPTACYFPCAAYPHLTPMMTQTGICIVLLQKTGEKFQKIAPLNIAEEFVHRIWFKILLNNQRIFSCCVARPTLEGIPVQVL